MVVVRMVVVRMVVMTVMTVMMRIIILENETATEITKCNFLFL